MDRRDATREMESLSGPLVFSRSARPRRWDAVAAARVRQARVRWSVRVVGYDRRSYTALTLRYAPKEGLAALQGSSSATSDALLFSASLTLWHLERFSSVESAAVSVRKILSSGKAAERFKRAV